MHSTYEGNINILWKIFFFYINLKDNKSHNCELLYEFNLSMFLLQNFTYIKYIEREHIE